MKKDITDLRKDYTKGEMREGDLQKNPLLQFQEWFEEAIRVYAGDANGMSLSTVNVDGKPSSRIVLLKEVLEEGFVFYTNYESRKGKHIDANANGALLFWWPELERQIRIEGTLSKVSREMSDAYFYSRPKMSQIGAICSQQSRELDDRESLERQVEEFVGEVTRPAHWGGYLLKPNYFEFWQGRASRLHDRLVYERNEKGTFTIKRLYP